VFVHYIFEVTLSPGYSAEAYAEAWIRASEIIQRAPGAQGTRLHRKIGDPTRLLAIATWESKSARDAMESTLPQQVMDIIAEQTPHVEITLLGEFEAPEWEVVPEA
tara:strand:- start:8345 stop:8662 length:318 start_codon:yes stop_codon:yes gene_type:complete